MWRHKGGRLTPSAEQNYTLVCGWKCGDVGYVKVTDLSFPDAVVFYRPLFCHFCLIVSRGMRWKVIPREPHHTKG